MRIGLRCALISAVAALLAPAVLPAAAASAATTTAAAPAAPAAGKTYTIWMWNVAGDKIHDGATGNGLITQAAGSIVNRSADLVAFNELCQNQYDALVEELRGRSWAQNPQNFARFEPSRPAGTASICKGGAFGNAIFSKVPLGAADRFALPHDGSAERRNMLCAEVQNGWGTRFCTTHITTNQDHNVSQLGFVRDKLESFHSAGETPLIAGDFNAQPHYGRLNSYYSPSLNTANNSANTGQYRELDDDAGNCPGYGEWTSEGTPGATPPCGGKAKLDLIFARESTLVGGYSADSLGISTACTGVTACSDHRIVVGTVTVV